MPFVAFVHFFLTHELLVSVIKMKGMELPINMIVVIAIAVLVLVVVAAFFAGRLGSGTDEIALNSAFNNGCTTLRTVYNCVDPGPGVINVRGYVPSGQSANAYSNGYPFSGSDSICDRKGFGSSGPQCAQACGCQIAQP